MPACHVLVPHEGGWYVAELLRQYRHEARWRALVRYTTAPGFTYLHARWCDELRPVPDDHVATHATRDVPQPAWVIQSPQG